MVSAAAAAILALSMSLTAVGSTSKQVRADGVVTVDSVNNGVDGNGNKITATLGEVPADSQDAVAEVRKPKHESAP